MSIEKIGGGYVPTCDFCGEELPEEYDFYDAVDAKKAAGWKSVKDKFGEWADACPDCAAAMGRRPSTAKDDFRGIGKQ